MNGKKQIMNFIKPNLVPVIILLVIPPLTIIALLILLCSTIPTIARAKKNIKNLEEQGALEAAAAELTSPNAKRWVKGKLFLTENYVFCKGNGRIFTYDEILWAYKQHYVKRALFIPIKTTDSLYLAAKNMKPRAVASMGKDKMDEIRNAMCEIRNHNKRCLIGYTNENVAAYKQLSIS